MGWAVFADFWLGGWTPVANTSGFPLEAFQTVLATALEASEALGALSQTTLEPLDTPGVVTQGPTQPIDTGQGASQVVAVAGSFLDDLMSLSVSASAPLEANQTVASLLAPVVFYTSPSLLTSAIMWTTSLTSSSGSLFAETELRPVVALQVLQVDTLHGIATVLGFFTSQILETSPSLSTAEVSPSFGLMEVVTVAALAKMTLGSFETLKAVLAVNDLTLDAWAAVIPDVPGSLTIAELMAGLVIVEGTAASLVLVESGAGTVKVADGT